jgi:hypothetical protein
LRFIVPNIPDDPPRSSVPLAANAPAVTPQDHIDVEPDGYPVPTPTGQLSDVTVIPLVRVTPRPPELNREIHTIPLPLLVKFTVQLLTIESCNWTSFQMGHGLAAVQFPAASREVADVLVT